MHSMMGRPVIRPVSVQSNPVLEYGLLESPNSTLSLLVLSLPQKKRDFRDPSPT